MIEIKAVIRRENLNGLSIEIHYADGRYKAISPRCSFPIPVLDENGNPILEEIKVVFANRVSK